MNIQVEQISPSIATELLAMNTNNRSLNAQHVRFLASQMKAGSWKMAGDPIRISTTGRLLDGQHRLSAIVESEQTLAMVIIRDLPDETFDVMDTGRIRSASDVLSTKSIANSNTAAAAARMLINYDRGNFAHAIGLSNGRKGKAVVTNTEIAAFFDAHKLMPFIDQGIKWYARSRIFTASEYGALYYILNKLDTERSLFFLTSLASGTGLTADSPIYILRRKLEQYKFNKVSCPPTERLALTIKAWNLFRQGKTVSMLTYNHLKESFPTPL